MRLITGTVESTPLQWLPVLSNITQSKLRREASLFRELKSCQLQVVPPIRLRSRFVIWTIDPGPLQDGYRIVDLLENHGCQMSQGMVTLWMNIPLFLLDLTWNAENWSFWTDFAPHKASVRTWCIDSDLPVCDCGFAQQTTTQILDCPLRPFVGGLLTVLHQVSSEADVVMSVYLTNLDVDLAVSLLFHQYF
jgi:hypothetical protein